MAAALNLESEDLHEAYPLEVASNGLPYLLVPVRQRLKEARIVAPDFAGILASWGSEVRVLVPAGDAGGAHLG